MHVHIVTIYRLPDMVTPSDLAKRSDLTRRGCGQLRLAKTTRIS
jgi:hypothetical protein